MNNLDIAFDDNRNLGFMAMHLTFAEARPLIRAMLGYDSKGKPGKELVTGDLSAEELVHNLITAVRRHPTMGRAIPQGPLCPRLNQRIHAFGHTLITYVVQSGDVLAIPAPEGTDGPTIYALTIRAQQTYNVGDCAALVPFKVSQAVIAWLTGADVTAAQAANDSQYELKLKA